VRGGTLQENTVTPICYNNRVMMGSLEVATLTWRKSERKENTYGSIYLADRALALARNEISHEK